MESTAPVSASSCDELVGPLGVRVELEPEGGIESEPGVEPVGRRRAAEAAGDDERDGLRLPSERFSEGSSRLAQGKVERRALVGPAAVVVVGVLGGFCVEQR